MPSESPFLLFKVECPICKTINEFEQIKVGAYTEESRDTDFCPVNITWRYPRYQAQNPLLYFTATCSNCYYTREFTNNYKEWKNDNTFRTYRLKTIKTKHLEQLSTADSILKRFGEVIDTQRHHNESAIIKLHLAVFDEQLSDHVSNLDLGRYYLRIAWVFRDLNKGENPGQTLLNSLLREMNSRYCGLAQAVENSRQSLDELNASVTAQFEAAQIPAEIQSRMFSHRDRFESELATINETVGSTETKLEQFKSLLDEYRTDVLGGQQVDGQVPFAECSSFTDYLLQLQRTWDGVVTSEREALEHAIRFYKEAYSSGRDIAAGAQQIQAAYLIAELSRRIGDHDEAKRFFASTIKSGQEFIYEHRRDRSRTVLARKILELAIEQGRTNLQAAETA